MALMLSSEAFFAASASALVSESSEYSLHVRLLARIMYCLLKFNRAPQGSLDPTGSIGGQTDVNLGKPV
jgi:hypothetical protein